MPKVFFAWYDFWIGAYFDRKTRDLYLCPLPCLVIKFENICRWPLWRRCRHCRKRLWRDRDNCIDGLYTGVVDGKEQYTCHACLDTPPKVPEEAPGGPRLPAPPSRL